MLDFNLVLIFLTAMAFCLACVPISMVAASRLKVYSPVDFRRKNRMRIPLLGGIAIYLSCLLSTSIYSEEAMLIVLAALPIVIAGVIDDFKELGSKPKFFAQLISVTVLLYFREPGSLVLEQVGLSSLWANLFTAFWIIGVTNAYNFIDGMDGVAGGVALIAGVTLSIMMVHSPLAPLGLIIAGASLSFLFFNWPPAKLYLGDAGSTFLGFALASLAAQIPMRFIHPLWVTAPMFVLAIPQIDAILAMYRRAELGLSFFKGDHDHIHHRLQKIGLNTRQAMWAIYGVAAYCSLTAFALFYTANIKFAVALLVLTASALCAILWGIYFVQLRLAQQVSTYSQTLIQKYFDVKENLLFEPLESQIVVFDLLPYYKELQQRGIFIVDRFISSFSRIVEKCCPTAQIKTLGSYSVVLLLPKADKSDGVTLVDNYYSLLKDFNIVRSESRVPEGVAFYSSEKKKEEFLQIVYQLSENEKAEEKAA